MLKYILLPAFCLISFLANAQKKAITEDGDEVILYTQGTWEYLNKAETSDKPIPVNPLEFKKSDKSTFLLKSKRIKVGVWLNPTKWTFKASETGDATEYTCRFKAGDLYGMIVTEGAQIPLESFKSIAFQNVKKLAPDAKLIKEEYRTVNGNKVLMLQINCTLKDIKFSYFGYYYSDENGSVQFLTYTSQNLFPKFQSECETLLNGFVVIK